MSRIFLKFQKIDWFCSANLVSALADDIKKDLGHNHTFETFERLIDKIINKKHGK